MWFGPSPTIGENKSSQIHAYAGGEWMPKLAGGTAGIYPQYLLSSRWGGTASYYSLSTGSVTGPTAGVERSELWWSAPLTAAVTISGSMTFNIWARETNMTDNAAVNVRLWKADATTGAITNFFNTSRVTELGTTLGAENWTQTPTSQSFEIGDRIGVSIFYDDAGTMASGGTLYFVYGSSTAAGTGDSWIQFTENLSFASGTRTGTRLYMTNSNYRNINFLAYYDLSFSNTGTGSYMSQTCVAGPAAPQKFPISWVSPQLESATIGPVVWPYVTADYYGGGNPGIVAVELLCVDPDGYSNPVTLGYSGWGSESTVGYAYLSTGGNTPADFALGTRQYTIPAGNRLVIKGYVDDGPYAMQSTQTAEILAGAGWSYIDLGTTLTTYTAPSGDATPFPYIGGGYYGA